MCGRFTLRTPGRQLADFVGLPDVPDLPPRLLMAQRGQRTSRKPATKYPQLRKKLAKNKILAKQAMQR
jgi:hypothetical protein